MGKGQLYPPTFLKLYKCIPDLWKIRVSPPQLKKRDIETPPLVWATSWLRKTHMWPLRFTSGHNGVQRGQVLLLSLKRRRICRHSILCLLRINDTVFCSHHHQQSPIQKRDSSQHGSPTISDQTYPLPFVLLRRFPNLTSIKPSFRGDPNALLHQHKLIAKTRNSSLTFPSKFVASSTSSSNSVYVSEGNVPYTDTCMEAKEVTARYHASHEVGLNEERTVTARGHVECDPQEQVLRRSERMRINNTRLEGYECV
ncbi:hypothetical protein PIB30_024453 [Stylosanthes scabra]|uniref:Uncharacterized protein n=1 Tax=Stylosanthes scabra TaxID=79078 RepID=A0ABU6X9Y9_9FABA|nr:hypothetical protein [Stylosanthes scabra]